PLDSAPGHFKRVLALYGPPQQRSLTVLIAENARVALLSCLSLTLGLLGFVEQARLRSTEALAEARELSHPISLAFALSVACRLHFVLAEPRTVLRRAVELIGLTTDQGVGVVCRMWTGCRGW